MYGFYDIAQHYDIIEQSTGINNKKCRSFFALQLLPFDRFNWDFLITFSSAPKQSAIWASYVWAWHLKNENFYRHSQRSVEGSEIITLTINFFNLCRNSLFAPFHFSAPFASHPARGRFSFSSHKLLLHFFCVPPMWCVCMWYASRSEL